MKFTKFFMTLALAVFVGFGVTACNEDDGIVDPGTDVKAPTALQAVSLSTTSVGLKWEASATAGATYSVKWLADGTTDTMTQAATTTSYIATGLTAGKKYTFWVYAVSGTDRSTPATIEWAGARRYTTDQAAGGQIRIYEKASVGNPSGLILKGGARAVSVATGQPNLGDVALAFDVISSTQFDFGAAYALTQFANADKFDSTTYISTDSWLVPSLDQFYLNKSLETYINSTNGNISAFTFNNTVAANTGVAFVVRHGNGANRHYARVFVKADAQGNLVRGTAPNRYIEVEISYQETATIPYAKRAPLTVYRQSYVKYPLEDRPFGPSTN